MSLGDELGDLGKSSLFKNSINQGEVFLKKFDGIDHDKFFIVAGISRDRAFLCSVFINSRINPGIMKKQELLELQIPLKKSNNPFLKYDSYANCSTNIPMKLESVSKGIADHSCKVIGSICKDDLELIVEKLKNSDLLSEEDIEMYFS